MSEIPIRKKTPDVESMLDLDFKQPKVVSTDLSMQTMIEPIANKIDTLTIECRRLSFFASVYLSDGAELQGGLLSMVL